jgi:hypothetical protein
VLYWHKGGRKGTTTEKEKERIYKKKNPAFVAVLCSPFFSFLILATHNYS